jgi:hypothetical protein
MQESAMSNENVPPPTSPETPPIAPYDPPAPAPQAAAWQRALKVVGYQSPPRLHKVIRSNLIKSTVRRDKWI